MVTPVPDVPSIGFERPSFSLQKVSEIFHSPMVIASDPPNLEFKVIMSPSLPEVMPLVPENSELPD